MQSETVSVILAGVGGQGILLASEIVAQAAMNAGYQVKTNEVHGMAQRGGSVIAQIRYGREVNSPLIPVRTAKALGAFEKIEALRFAHYVAPDGLAAVSSQMVIPVTVSNGQATYPEDAEARLRKVFGKLLLMDAAALAEQAGNIRAANTVVVGALSTGLDLPLEAWQDALASCVAEKYRDVNMRGFMAGRNAA